jgi:hypothetical protein
MRKRVYYDGPDAVVTDQLFVWRASPRKSYVVRDLHNVGVLRSDSRPASPATVLMAAAGTVAAVGAGWTMFEPPTAYALGLLAVTVPLACAVPSMVRRPRGWELHALYRGTDVVLYACLEERQFNQVKRALRRSLENARPPERGRDLAAA